MISSEIFLRKSSEKLPSGRLWSSICCNCTVSGPTISSGSLFFLAVFCIRNPLKPSRDCIFLIGYIKPWSLAESSNCLILSWFGSVGSISHCGSGRPEKTNKVIFKFPTTNAKKVYKSYDVLILYYNQFSQERS